MRNCFAKVRRAFGKTSSQNQLDGNCKSESDHLQRDEYEAAARSSVRKGQSCDKSANATDKSSDIGEELVISNYTPDKHDYKTKSLGGGGEGERSANQKGNKSKTAKKNKPHANEKAVNNCQTATDLWAEDGNHMVDNQVTAANKGVIKINHNNDDNDYEINRLQTLEESYAGPTTTTTMLANASEAADSGWGDSEDSRAASRAGVATTVATANSMAGGAQSYIAEYRSFVEDKQPHPISTPYPSTESFNFEQALNQSTLNRSSITTTTAAATATTPSPAAVASSAKGHGAPLRLHIAKANAGNNKNHTTPHSFVRHSSSSNTPNSLPTAGGNTPANTPVSAKTPEEIEYEAKLVAESEDVMTPLPTSTLSSKQLTAHGRVLPPEIAEVIRSLDSNALRINNLTNEDKLELMRRLDSQQHQQQRRNSRSKQQQHYMRLQLHEESSESGGDSNDGTAGVVLRRKPHTTTRHMAATHKQKEASPAALLSPPNSGLYERRQPTSPKLKLLVKTRTGAAEQAEADAELSEKNLMDVKYPTVLPPNPQLKALLVFHKTDNICEVVTQACHRQHLDVTVVKSKEAALEILSATTAECYHLIIIDARSTKYLDAEYITRSIRHTNGHHFTTIIAVVKKSFFEKDDVFIALLDAGVNRCIAETTNLSLCSIELKQILHSIVRPHNVMSTQQALYTALHRLKEVLIITDDVLRIQYANKSAERLLNMRLDEIISKPLADIFISDVSSISAHGKSIKEFDGILTVRRKSQDGIPMHVRVVPVACIGRTPTHFVFNFDVPGGQSDFIATLPQPKEAPRGSLHSIRRGSFDVRSVASDGLRRTSLAKLTSLPLEAPITKIINLLSQVQENCSSDEARLIDKVMEFLKREGLYSPQMKEIRPDDPIATDLIGALLTGPSLYSSRRSSNDSIIRVSGSRPSGIMPAKMKATPLIMELLEESLCWEFDIFKLEDITERRPLLYLGMEMFRRFDVFATFNIEENVAKGWLAVIEAHYHAQNSYHNSSHAADVMQATGAFMNQLATKEMVMDRMDEATALIAAAAHDIDHPGRSSAFLCNSNSPLAILYNDLTVLESHHAATTFRLTLDDDKINIFKNLDKDTYKSVRSTIIDMILATEMTRHFEHLAKFVSVFGTDVEPRDIVQTEDESSILIRRMLIKVADVSNPARPTAFCVEWARRIAEEYFMQTDEEKANALPIVMPMFDRATCSIPKSQIGFIEYIIQDMMHAWDSFIDMPQLITYMQINYSQWKKYEEQGIHTLADIKTKQVSLNAKKTTAK